MKKFGLFLSLVLILTAVSPAIAWFDQHRSTETLNNFAMVTSNTQAGAFTGNNVQFSGVTVEKASADDIHQFSYNSMQTGAAKADADSRLLVNTNYGCNTCMQRYTTRTTETNMAMVQTETMAQADTGMNTQQNGVTVERAHVDDVTNMGTNKLTTGAATANASSLTLVNVEWNHMMMW